MTLQCERCGAPLEIAPGASIAKCNFCHASTSVSGGKTTGLPKAPVWPTAFGPAPGSQSAPRGGFPQGPSLNVAAAQYAQAQARRVVVGVMFAVGALVAVGVAVAVNGGGLTRGLNLTATPTLGSIDVGPVAPLHIERMGNAGGPIEASRLGPSCRGHFPRAAHMLLHLRQPAVLSLTTANSSTDLTMAVRSPDGTILCDDDHGQGNNPLIQSSFAAGDTRVWIGTYSDSNTGSGFTLSVDVQATGTSTLVNGLAPDATPMVGVIDPDLAPGGVQFPITVTGTVDGSHVGGNCRGHYGAAPSAVLRLSSPRYVSLTTTGTEDLTMLVRAASNGMLFCDDDSGQSMNPLITQLLPPGVYGVWVGPYSAGHTTQITLSVITDQPTGTDPSGLSPNMPPSLGAYDPGSGVPQSWRGLAVQHIPGAMLDGRCSSVGFLTTPHLSLQTAAPRRVMVDADGEQINVLLRTPEGTSRCLGSGSERHVSGMIDLPVGASQLWVGTSTRNQHVPFTLSLQPFASAPAMPRTTRGGRMMQGGPSR